MEQEERYWIPEWEDWIKPARGNRILSNSIYDNANHGIDPQKMVLTYEDPGEGPFPDPIMEVLETGPTPNDLLDEDSGANDLLNTPALSQAYLHKGKLNVGGSLEGLPDSEQLVQVFSSRRPDESGFGEAARWLPRPVKEHREYGTCF